jgi:outer membrane lipoprotein SlyB
MCQYYSIVISVQIRIHDELANTQASNYMLSHDCLIGVFPNLETAREALENLKRDGWSDQQVSLLTRGQESELDMTQPLTQGDGMEKSAAVGAAAGAALGLLASTALLIIPGIGPVIFAGAMASGITGGLVGGIVGAMSGWGVKENHAREFEAELRNGKTLVVVTGEPQTLAAAETILEDSDADRVSLLAETADSTVDR